MKMEMGHALLHGQDHVRAAPQLAVGGLPAGAVLHSLPPRPHPGRDLNAAELQARGMQQEAGCGGGCEDADLGRAGEALCSLAVLGLKKAGVQVEAQVVGCGHRYVGHGGQVQRPRGHQQACRGGGEQVRSGFGVERVTGCGGFELGLKGWDLPLSLDTGMGAVCAG